MKDFVFDLVVKVIVIFIFRFCFLCNNFDMLLDDVGDDRCFFFIKVFGYYVIYGRFYIFVVQFCLFLVFCQYKVILKSIVILVFNLIVVFKIWGEKFCESVIYKERL